jgi:hypothetical protein
MTPYPVKPHRQEEHPRAELNALLEAMRHVLETWAYLPSGHIGEPVEGPAKLSLERSVRMTGQEQAFLNVRTLPELGSMLYQYARGEEGGVEGDEDAFNEFVNIYCGHLMTYLWGKERAHFKPYLPLPSTPSDWPAADPSAACVFITEDIPVEVRLWIGIEKD